MLNKGQQKSSTGLSDRVIVRKGVKNKCYNHVKKPRAFCKAQTVSELALTNQKGAHRKADLNSSLDIVLRRS